MKFSFVLVIVMLFIEIPLSAKGSVIIKEKDVNVSSDRIHLGDIAEISGFASPDREALGTLYIKRAAVPGHRAIIEREYVENRVEKAFPGTEVKGRDRISVHTLKTEVKASEVRQRAIEFVRERMPWKEEDTKITLKGSGLDRNVPEGEITFSVRETGRQKFRGNVIVPVDIEVNGRYYRTEPVSMLVEVSAECYYAESEIRRGQAVELKDVKPVKREITFLPDDIITNEAFFNNVTAKRAIVKGTLLTEAMFEKRPLFRRGDTVKVIARIGTAVVETTGTARSDGREGGTVEVNVVTGKIISGKVDADGSVLIQSR